MSRIKIARSEAKEGDLPNLCMICGKGEGETITNSAIVYAPFPLSLLGYLGELASPKKEQLAVVTCAGCTNNYRYETTMQRIVAIGYTLALFSITYPLSTLHEKDILVPLIAYTIVITMHAFYHWSKGKHFAIRCVGMDKTSVSLDLPQGAWGVAYTKYKKDKADLRLNGIPSPLLAAKRAGSSTAGAAPEPQLASKGLALEGCELIRIPGTLPDFLAAVAQGDCGRVESMISKGDDINTSLANGMNALHIASILGEMQMADLLIRYGLNVNAEMGNGLTAMHLAVQSNNQGIVGLLLSKKADPNHKNQDGRTPLHWCAAVQDDRLDSNNRYKMAQLLFKSRGDITATDKNGKTPAELAEEAGEPKIAHLLG